MPCERTLAGALLAFEPGEPGLADPSMIRIAHVEAFAFRVPIASPIKLAFGTFRERPAVYVRVTDEDGTEGWGEARCYWSAVGAEHRARLAADFGDLLVGQSFTQPGDLFRKLDAELDVLALSRFRTWPA